MDDWGMNDDTTKRDRIILFVLLFVSVALIIFGVFNQSRNRQVEIVRQSGAAGQAQEAASAMATAEPGSEEPLPGEGEGKTAVTGNDALQKAPGVGTIFLVAAASFLGFIVLMMAVLTGMMIFIERLRRRRAEVVEEEPSPPPEPLSQ